MDTVFNILHVAAAVFLIGPIAILPMISLHSLRAGDRKTTAATARTLRLFSYLSLLVIVTGFAIMGMADPAYNLSITTPWVLASLVLYVGATLLTLAVVVRSFQRSTAPNSYVRALAGSVVSSLALLAAVVLMVWKP